MKKEIIEAAHICSGGECSIYCPLFGYVSCARKFREAIVDHHNKYGWHNLVKNPDDLPEDGRLVDVRDKCGNSYYTHVDFYGTYNRPRKVWHYSIHDIEPIAWREIEPHESED